MNFLSSIGSIESNSSMRKQLIFIIILTLISGLGITTFFSITFFIEKMEEREEAQNKLLASTIIDTIRENMVSGNSALVIAVLERIRNKGLKEVKIFRITGEEGFKDNKTINSVNNWLGDNIFPLRPVSEIIKQSARIETEMLKKLVSGAELSFNKKIDVEPVHTMLFPIKIDDDCISCHGYGVGQVRGILQISISRTGLLDSIKIFSIRAVVGIFVIILAIAVIMNRLINIRIIKPITDAIFKISSGTEEQDQIISQQASSVNQITTTIEELNASSKQVYEKADSLAEQAKETLKIAYEGQKAIENSVSEMNLIKNKVEAIAEEVLALSENTNQIGAIINVVDDIANKTDMLALNAAIEAAKAGEQGKGFAVVASEVRSLADQSKKATEKVSTLIQEIQKAVNSTVMATEEGSKKVDLGVSHILNAGSTINDTIETFRTTADAANEITIAARQESLANDQVAEAMHHINEGMKESSIATKESLQIVQELQKVVDRRNLGRID